MQKLTIRVSLALVTFGIGTLSVVLLVYLPPELVSSGRSNSVSTLAGSDRFTNPLASPTATPLPKATAERAVEVFQRELRSRTATGPNAEIVISPLRRVIKARDMNLAWGKRAVLSIPIEIRNNSAKPIQTSLSHEWYGGIWPPTDLHVVLVQTDDSHPAWSSPAYQVGERGSADSKLTVKSGESISLDIRLNWPGTGSVPASPLISASSPGHYTIKFLLYFTEGDREMYAKSADLDIDVQD